MSRRNQRRLSFGAAFDEAEWAAAVEEAQEEVANDYLSAGSRGGRGGSGGAHVQNTVHAAAQKLTKALPSIKPFSLPT
eukprot:gene26316-12250_t